MERQSKGRGCRGVLAPFPLHGHLTPMLQLGMALYNSGFSITIVYSTFNSPNFSQYPQFDLKPIPTSEELHASIAHDDPTLFLQLVNRSCEAPFRKYMSELMEDERVACIISDSLIYFTTTAAQELGVPRFILFVISVNSFLAMAATPLLLQKGYLPIKYPPSEEPVGELPPLRVKDLFYIKTEGQDIQHPYYQLVDTLIEDAIHTSGLIFNTFEFLEEEAISKVKQQFATKLFPIAPLHKLAPPHFNSLLKPNADCIEWLDQQEQKSVVYVSFGSLAAIEKPQLLEIACGLAKSEVPFLWVLRPDLVIGEEHVKLPVEIEEEIKSRKGFVVDWAPQREVLAHPAVGGFWTQCGWNSVMESICEGVPMICTPFFGDQNVNARFVSYVWKVGIQIEEELERGVVKNTIRRMMVEKEGEEMKDNVEAMKEKALLCAREGNPSHDSFMRFFNQTCLIPDYP